VNRVLLLLLVLSTGCAKVHPPVAAPTWPAALDLQITPDGKRMAVSVTPAGGPPAVQVWDLGETPRLAFQSDRKYGGGTPALSLSGAKVVACGLVYDVASGKRLATLPGWVYAHAFFRGEDTVVATQHGHNSMKPKMAVVTVWDVATDRDAGSFKVPDRGFGDAFPAKDGAELWLFQSAGRWEVECWDVAAKALVRTVTPDAPPTALKPMYCGVAPDGSAFGGSFRSGVVYNGVTGDEVGRVPAVSGGMTNGMTPGGTRMFVISYVDSGLGPEVIKSAPGLIDWKARRVLATLGGFSADAKNIHVVATPDCKTAVAVSEQGQACVYDLAAVK
jgi:hypothetical protein